MRITRRSATDPDQERVCFIGSEIICFIGSESLLYTFQRILHTLRVTGIIKIVQKTKRNSIVEYLEIRYPFQLCVLGALREFTYASSKGARDMQVANEIKMRLCDLNIWLCENFFLGQSI